MAIVPVYPTMPRYPLSVWPAYPSPYYPPYYPPYLRYPLPAVPAYPYPYLGYTPAYSYDYYSGSYLPSSYISPENPGNYWIWP